MACLQAVKYTILRIATTQDNILFFDYYLIYWQLTDLFMAITNFYSMTDKAIAHMLGQRFRDLRLRRNITQQQLAETTALSLNVIKALEQGKGKLTTVIAVLRELQALDELENLLPETQISPLQLARLQGKQRQRARGSRGQTTEGDDSW